MFCCFVALDDVHEKSTSHHLGNCQFLLPFQPGFGCLPLSTPTTLAARASTATWWSMEIPGRGAAKLFVFSSQTNKIAMAIGRPFLRQCRWIQICCHQNPRTLHPSNGLGTLRNGVRTIRRQGVSRFTNQNLTDSWLGIANGSGRCPTLETKLIFQGPKNSTEPWLWESLSRWWVILKSLQNLGLDTKSWLLYAERRTSLNVSCLGSIIFIGSPHQWLFCKAGHCFVQLLFPRNSSQSWVLVDDKNLLVQYCGYKKSG